LTGFVGAAADTPAMGQIEDRALLTFPEVAKILRVSLATLKRLQRQGKLPALKVGGQWRVEPQALEQYLETQRRAAA
jgi:excisionase family DNA binding protein